MAHDLQLEKKEAGLAGETGPVNRKSVVGQYWQVGRVLAKRQGDRKHGVILSPAV